MKTPDVSEDRLKGKRCYEADPLHLSFAEPHHLFYGRGTGSKRPHHWHACAQAAGVIHTDFEKGFIRAEVIKYNDFIQYRSEAACRDAGKLAVQEKTTWWKTEISCISGSTYNKKQGTCRRNYYLKTQGLDQSLQAYDQDHTPDVTTLQISQAAFIYLHSTLKCILWKISKGKLRL